MHFLNERLRWEGPATVGGATPRRVGLGYLRKYAEQVMRLSQSAACVPRRFLILPHLVDLVRVFHPQQHITN